MEEKHNERVGAAGGENGFNPCDGAAMLASGAWSKMDGLCKSVPDRTERTSDTPSLPGLELSNHWHSAGTVRKGFDRIKTSAAVNVPAEAFLALNPGEGRTIADLPGLVGKDGFKVRHATTGEVDGGWQLDSVSKDGSISLSRDYAMEVRNRSSHDRLIETLAGVPPEHVSALEQKLAQLPPHVLKALEDKGYKIIATPTNTDAIPDLKGKTPRGWPQGSTFDDSDGTHDNVRRVILAPYSYRQGNEFVPVERPDVVVHQIGHALDHAYGKLSNADEFQQAFRSDMKRLAEKGDNMSDRERAIYDYFNQKDGPARGERPGSEEAFASLAGLLLSGPENPGDRPVFEKNFAATAEVVRHQIDNLHRKL
jgi:hypothetical protein